MGLSLQDKTPDETTFVVFRGRLRDAVPGGLDEVLFERALQQLHDRGLILQEGTLVDATIMEAPRPRKVVEADTQGNTTTRTIRDQEASFTRKHGRTYHGYKMHVATDPRGVIKKVLTDTAKVHDSNHFEALIEDELDGTGAGAAYGDSAYASAKHTALMDAHGVHDGTIKRRVRGQAALPWYQQHINAFNAKVRAVVEHPFAWIKQMGHRRVDLQLEDGVLQVRPEVGKTARADLLPLLRKYVGGMKPTDLVFYPLPQMKTFRRDLAKAGIPYRDDHGRQLDFHALRATFATRLLREGVHPSIARRYTRHGSVQTLEKHYDKLGLDDARRESLSRLAGTLGRREYWQE